MRSKKIIVGLLLTGAVVACDRREMPGLGVASLQVHPALEVSLFAGEPQVVDPVALTFDEAGRMYVVEMRDYPLGVGPDDRVGSTIRLLQDTDGDGRCDSSILFAEDLSFPTSIAAWRGGVFVTAPPQILYLADTDGDGRADVREIIFDGFALGVTDSNMNGLRWGLDNRIHGSNGGNDGAVVESGGDAPATPIRGLDFSFDPDDHDFRTTFHSSSGFGLAFDLWGRSFSTYNIDHLQQRVVEARYLSRRPELPPLRATHNISVHGAMARIYPISVPETRVNHPEQAGYYSSAGGLTFLDWNESHLPAGILIGDVVGNLMSREVLEVDGPLFRAERAAEERQREFLASTDNSFRAVGAEMGPDGALYVIDMHRAVIEHPDYIPEVVKETLDLRAGSDRGRIYRLAPRGTRPSRPESLVDASSERLIELLSSDSRWWRMTAQRLLVERGGSPPLGLVDLATGGTTSLGRLHALWTLEGLGAMNGALVLAALGDPEAALRENALQLAEAHMNDSEELRRKVISLADDADVRVRFQAALTIGELAPPIPDDALAAVWWRDLDYRWSRLAVLSSLGPAGHRDLLAQLVSRPPGAQPLPIEAISELTDIVAAGFSDGESAEFSQRVISLLAVDVSQAERLAILEGLRTGVERSRSRPTLSAGGRVTFERVVGRESMAVASALLRLGRSLGFDGGAALTQWLGTAREVVRDRGRELAERGLAAQLLAMGTYREASPVLYEVLERHEPSSLQHAAFAAIAGFDNSAVGRELVLRWRRLPPSLRPLVLRQLLRVQAFHGDLLDALESGAITLGELNLDLEQRRRLMRLSTPAIHRRAAALIGDEEYGNRAEIVLEVLAELPATGSKEDGRQTFESVCAQCHRHGGLGNAVGPDLESVSHRSAEDLVSNILDPDMAINPAFTAYRAELASGGVELGILESESPEAVTLVQPFGVRKILLRSEISSLESSAVSLMPAGLEQGLTPQDLRDLVAFIQDR